MTEKITEKIDALEPITFEEFEKKAVVILEGHKKKLDNPEKDITPVLFRGQNKSASKKISLDI